MTGRSELDARIKDHLAEVARHLGGLPASERAEIVRGVEAHIHDALEDRARGEPSLHDLEVVLASMDPPEAYALEAPPPGPVAQGAHAIRWQTKLLGAAWLVLFVGMANAASEFRAIFGTLGLDTLSLPVPTRAVLGAPFALWIAIGLVGGAGIVAKSRFLSAETSRLVDRIFLLALLLIGALAVASLMLPVISLQASLSGHL